MELTQNQINLMEHTMQQGRNWFGTCFTSKDAIEFEKLWAAGYATKETPPKWMGDDVIYRLTSAGKEVLKKWPTNQNGTIPIKVIQQ